MEVDKGKIMKFDVYLTEEAQENLSDLQKIDQKKVLKAIDIIENVDIDAVNTRPLTDKIYKIKTDNIRSLFAYTNKKIIIIALIFIKKTQKTPAKYIDKAIKILKEYEL